jgi:putative SOS response-associated peptidase YedK
MAKYHIPIRIKISRSVSIFYTRRMCGRYRRRSDKQRIAEVFEAGIGFEGLYLEPSDDVRPESIQPIVYRHSSGERAIALMRWGFKTPDRLLFNARSEMVTTANFWKDSFLKRRCLVPADGFYEWVRPASRSDDCPAWSHDRTCRPIGSTPGGQAVR